ncbi:polysaccharide deacetylase family protein [Legionella tunisiensis]|uniref:polysaccharide deacetylase family protein n=1 Tax=Legionella tunisiensis TaxID=1034944 RepID=UPI000373169C|nr:polysaccharide deacetylase family protein [Legionella tunisiensis]
MNTGFAHKRLIAITIDDLPFVGEAKNFHLNMIIDAIKSHEVPATGFIIAGEVSPDNWKMLHKFRDSGLGLGNHTFSHLNLNKVDTEAYIEEIDAADKMLMPVLTEPKFFRYPYLAMSGGTKKDKVLRYLSKNNYHVAPITIDSKDFIFNQLLLDVPQNQRRSFLGALKVAYIDFIWQQTLKAEEHARYNHKSDQAQILLIHANLLNAYVLPDIINLYKQNGFTFVSLEDALDTSAPIKCLLRRKYLKVMSR